MPRNTVGFRVSYELELDVGRADVAGPYQSHADTKQLRATRPDLARRMNANRKGHVTELTRSDAHARKGPAP